MEPSRWQDTDRHVLDTAGTISKLGRVVKGICRGHWVRKAKENRSLDTQVRMYVSKGEGAQR